MFSESISIHCPVISEPTPTPAHTGTDTRTPRKSIHRVYQLLWAGKTFLKPILFREIFLCTPHAQALLLCQVLLWWILNMAPGYYLRTFRSPDCLNRNYEKKKREGLNGMLRNLWPMQSEWVRLQFSPQKYATLIASAQSDFLSSKLRSLKRNNPQTLWISGWATL